MKVLGLQNKGVSKRLEEYSEEEILQAFQKESENLSQYKTIQHSSSINIIVWDVHHWNFWSSFSHFLEVAKVKCKSFRMCTRPTSCLQRWSAPYIIRQEELKCFFLQSVPCRPGDPCKEAAQEGDPGEEGVRGHGGGGRHLQEENVGHQVEHLVSKKHSQSRIAMENLCHCICNCQCVKFATIESIEKRAQTQTQTQ